MPITYHQAVNLANHLADIRPGWTVPSLVSFLRSKENHPARFEDMAQALCVAARDPKAHTPALAFEDPRFWPKQAPERPTGSRCPAHPEDPNPASNCSGCRSDWLIGKRPKAYLGRIYPPLDGPDPAAA